MWFALITYVLFSDGWHRYVLADQLTYVQCIEDRDYWRIKSVNRFECETGA